MNNNASDPTTDNQPAAAGRRTRRALRPRTDLGNAERLADRAAGRLLWVEGLRWLAWDGRRFDRALSGEEVRMATDMVRSIYGEAAHLNARASASADADERDRLGKEAGRLSSWAKQSEAAVKIRAALDLARSREALVARPEDLDADADALNAANGILDLGTGELRPHDPDERHTKVANAAYDPEARSAAWDAFLARVVPSKEVRAYVQRAVGYSLLGRYSEHLFIPWGTGKNGKSTFLRAVRHALGDYAMEAAPELLIEKRGGRNAGDMSAAADLRGRRFVTTIETGEGKRLAETFVKQLTGEHVMKAKLMRQDWFEFENQTALWLATNHKPRVAGTDAAIWERLHLIPFNVWVPPTDQDPELGRKLEADADAVLAWAVEGLRDYRERGGRLDPPREVREATDDYKREMDPVRDWLEAACSLDQPGALTPVKWVRSSYVEHCQGEGMEPVDTRAFNSALEGRGLERKTKRLPGAETTTKVWVGLELAERWQHEYAARVLEAA